VKILAPFSLPHEVPELIAAGATELYCGVVPEELRHEVGDFESLNRRRGYDANLWSLEDLEHSTAVAHAQSMPVFVTLNRFFSHRQYPALLQLARDLRAAGADGLIVVDPALMLALRDEGVRFPYLAVGTGGSTFNASTVTFYRTLGATRVILSRHLTVPEIRAIAAEAPADVELEVFILHSLCPFEDGFCSFYHGHDPSPDSPGPLPPGCLPSYDPWFEGVGCRLRFQAHRVGEAGTAFGPVFAHDRADELRHGGADCGVCALPELLEAGIHSVKIVERAFPTQRKVSATQFVRRALTIAQSTPPPSRRDFQVQAQELYRQMTGHPCSGYECYYPAAVVARGSL
jgi:collagenase-like PrtC family protease